MAAARSSKRAGNPCRINSLAKAERESYSEGVKVWQALIVLIALIWVANTPRKRAIIATVILLLIAVGIGPAA